MEFLMTYGWAILAAIIVIGVLAIYFRPSQLSQNSIALTAPFYGVGVTFATNTVNMEIRNNGGEEVDIMNATLSLTSPASINCNTGGLNDMPAGNATVFSATCTGLDSGESVSGDVTVYYTRPGSSLTLQSTGSISGRVP